LTEIELNDKPVILKNNNFKSILISVMFFFEENEDDLAKIQILPGLLRRMCNKYPSEEEFQLEKKKLYILSTNCRQNVIGSTGTFTFDFVIPDVYAIDENILEEQFKFFREMIYAPKLDGKAFCKEEMMRIISNIKLGMEDALKNIRSYHGIKLRKLIDTDGILSRDLVHCPELLEKETPQSIYNYYLDKIYNNQPVIYIMGNVSNKEINKLCYKYLYRKEFGKVKIPLNFDNFLVPRNEVLDIAEESNFKDSIYSVVYKIKDMKKEDVIFINCIRDLLSSMSSWILNRKLRDEANLIYSSKVLVYPHFGVLEITVSINKNNLELVKEKLEEVMKELRNEEVIEEALVNIKLRKKKNLLRQLDDKYFIFDDFITSDLGIDIPYPMYYEEYNKITFSDICIFLDRLVLDTCYFLKEVEDDG